MLGQLKYAVKYVLGRDRAGKHYTVFPDDTFLVSYPKSGNTWVRFLLANLLHPNETVGFANINRLLPAPGVLSKRFLRSLPRPRILKSHETFDVRFRKVIYLVRDPRVSLLFLIPGVGETMRVTGRAKISTDPKLTESFAMNGKVPKCVLVVTVEKAYFQCTKAIIRSKLWDPATQVDRKTLPTPGSILAELTDGKMGGPEHDRLAPERIKQTIY